MLYVDINDVCNLFSVYVDKIINKEIDVNNGSLENIVNIYWPKPLTIYDLAILIRENVIESTNKKIMPEIEIVDTGTPMMFDEDDKNKMKVDQTRISNFLGSIKLTDPKTTLNRLIKSKIGT
jgi:hypothetical protein